MNITAVKKAYEEAKERFAGSGVDTEIALRTLRTIPLSLNCWQGDDVGGFEGAGTGLDGGLAVTGNWPGRARTPDELRSDLEKAMALIPGIHRINLHAIYGEFGGKKIDRDAIGPEHFSGWVDWAKQTGCALDFNATCFSHPKASSGFTLSDSDAGIRGFWVEHCRRARHIGAHMGKELRSPCVHNLWIPDGAKDANVNRWKHREFLRQSLDQVFSTRHDEACLLDAVEGKLFGIGSESFVVGSHEFYLAYAIKNGIMPCLDMGHYHPTESVADKVSAVLQFVPGILVHVSRGVRWDSDHVVTLNDELVALMQEIVRIPALDRTHLALDYFDASINRVGAWVSGARAAQKALLFALLEPKTKLNEYEEKGNNFGRMGLLEEAKAMPWSAVWDFHCLESNVLAGPEWIDEIMMYEKEVLSNRK